MGKKVKIVSEFSVHIYYGTILYYEGHTDEVLPQITVPENKLPFILDTESNAIFDAVETDIPEVLETIRSAIINIQKEAYFPMVEPNTKTF